VNEENTMHYLYLQTRSSATAEMAERNDNQSPKLHDLQSFTFSKKGLKEKLR